jgi:hypothetical protein
MLRFLVSVLALTFAAQLAFAASKPKAESKTACWQRVYTEAELKKHRRQKVSMALLNIVTQKDGSVRATLGLNLRKRVNTSEFDYVSYGLCKPKNQTLVCSPEWDAGSFVLEKGARGGLRVKNRKLIVNPYNYDSEDIADNAINFRKSDDAIWLLFQVNGAVCSLP